MPSNNAPLSCHHHQDEVRKLDFQITWPNGATGTWWQAMTRLNLAQRIVLVIGWGLALAFFGRWVTTRGRHLASVLPVRVHSLLVGGLHPWVRLVIWLALVVVWTAGAMWVLRDRKQSQPREAD